MTTHRTACRRRPVALASALLACTLATDARCEGRHEWLVFLDAAGVYHNSTPDDGLERYDFEPGADLLYSYSNGRFRTLGEYFASTEETELERLQLGWQSGETTMAWIGRFHQPSSYWNSVFHHGKYLQTSITRPSIDEFEDDGGVLPMHVSGGMLETGHGLNETAALKATLSAGLAPVLDQHTLKPFDLLDPERGHGLGIDARIAYLPDEVAESQVGLVLGWADIEVDGNRSAEQQGLNAVGQYRLGAYIDWHWPRWRVISALTSVINRLKRDARDQTDTFIAGYLQPEYELDGQWTAFARVEGTTHAHSSDYLQLFPNYITERAMLGLRFDYSAISAFSLELARAETVESRDFGQVLLQWSMVFP